MFDPLREEDRSVLYSLIVQEMSGTAVCRVCKATFEPTPAVAKKRDWICPPCNREWAFQYRQRRKAEGRPVRPGQLSLEKRSEYQRRPENRLKTRTRERTRQAIRRGLLTPKPCEVCGSAKSEAHHDDYSDHMNVRWFCRAHHKEHHRTEGARSAIAQKAP